MLEIPVSSLNNMPPPPFVLESGLLSSTSGAKSDTTRHQHQVPEQSDFGKRTFSSTLLACRDAGC